MHAAILVENTYNMFGSSNKTNAQDDSLPPTISTCS